jgi:Na+/melibiose symporter-like transporter
MDPTFAHPHWIVAGILLILGGFWLFRWARRNDSRAAISTAATAAAINKLRRNSPGKTSPRPVRASMAETFRNAMSQFLGIVGLLMIIAGLVAAIFGVFYVGA